MRRNKKKNLIFGLFFLVLFMGLGYAFLSSSLNINGTAKFQDASWDIHFENIVINPDSISLSEGDSIPTVDPSDNTRITYTFSFYEPGDFYEFEVDVVNAGTIDGMIETIHSVINGLPVTDLPNYMEYSLTYEDDSEIEDNHILKAGELETYKVRIGFKRDINASDLPNSLDNYSSSFSVDFVQADDRAVQPQHYYTLYREIKKNAVIDNVASEFVTSENGIDFSSISSDTNGKGVYIRAGTENDTYPIYYYRGNVDNNVLFGGFCWKIVRTTSTGGVKLIYNGVPTGTNSNQCTTYNGDGTNIGKSKFNTNYDSPADVGYMYGDERYSLTEFTPDGDYYHAPDVVYENGIYHLVAKGEHEVQIIPLNTYNSQRTYYHYTCGSSTETTCSEVRYIINLYGNPSEYSIVLSGGKKIEDVVSETLTNSSNKNESDVKTTIDNWYVGNLIDYASYLEDTPWCNDRTIYNKGSFNPDGGEYPDAGGIPKYFSLGGCGRTYSNHNPSFDCSLNDSFTVSSSNGNGKLTYPIAMITADEMTFAGGVWGVKNSSYYLNTQNKWWTLSPAYYTGDGNSYVITSIDNYSYFTGWISGVSGSIGVRPSISLKSKIRYSDGDGTKTNPYVIVTE